MSEPMTSTDRERRSRLLGVKLAALVRDHAGAQPEPGPVGVWPTGAALTAGGAAWVLLDEHPGQSLGRALAWARQHDLAELHVVADTETGVVARRAELFRTPITVWHAEGRVLLPAVPEPYPPNIEVPTEHEQFVELIVGAGADVHREHGVLTGDVAGLEVCRAVTDGYTGAARLEVGVGAHDREAFLLMHGDIPTHASLERIVSAVREVRRAGADPHPLNRLARERLFRAELVASPQRIGAAVVRPIDPPLPRRNLKDSVPCAAIATRDDGSTFVVACSTGIDLDLVPFGADTRRYVGGSEELVLATPARDAVPVTKALAASLHVPATVLGIDWTV